MRLLPRYTPIAIAASLAFHLPLAFSAPSDLDPSLVNAAASGSGTGALIAFGLRTPLAELKSGNRLGFIAAGAGCYATQQVTGTVYVTLATSGAFDDVKGPPCTEGNTPGSVARAGVYNAVKLSTGKYLLQADTEGLDIRLRLIRMNADGSIDTGYGTNGLVLPEKADGAAVLTGTGLRDASRMVVDAQDRIYVSANGNQVARLNANGVLDNSFGTQGYISAPFAAQPGAVESIAITELAIDAAGRLIVAGKYQEPAPFISDGLSRYWIARYDTAGAHDTSFRNDLGGSDNIVRIQAKPAGTVAPVPVSFLKPEASGSLLAVVDNQIRRYSSTGTLDAQATLPAENDAASGRTLGVSPLFLGVDGSGRIIVAGQGSNTQQAPLVRRTVIARYNSDLSADMSFDADDATPNGLRAYDLGSGRAFPSAQGHVLIASDGKINIVGRVDGSAPNAQGVAVIRLMGDGGGSGPVNDTTPDAFSFGVNANASANSVDTSSEVTISGIDVAVPISINSSAQGRGYSIGCTGSFTAEASTIENGQTVCVRHTTGSAGTRVATTLTVGGVTGSFESVVPSPTNDTTPDAFSFPAVSNAEAGSVVESAVRTISGFNTAAPISITGGEYRLSPNGGGYLSGASTIEPGQSVQLRVTAATAAGSSRQATVTIGGVSGSFTVTTRQAAGASTATIADAPNGAVTLSTTGGRLVNARTVPVPSGAPDDRLYPNGFFAFDVENVSAGSEITVQITLPSGSAPDSYVKCSSAGNSCSEFAGASFNGNVVTLLLRDGGAGDADGTVNGRISDPGAPALRNTAPPTGNDDGGGALGGGLLGLLALLAGRRIRRARH